MKNNYPEKKRCLKDATINLSISVLAAPCISLEWTTLRSTLNIC